MPFHWCMDETLALMAMLPFIGMFFRRIHTWWHTKFSHKCHEKTCESTHVEHHTLTEEDCDKLVEESNKYREAIQPRLDRLDHITAEDLKTRVK